VFAPRRDGIRVENAAGAVVHGSSVDDAAGGDGIRLSRVGGGHVDLNFVQGSYVNGIRIQSSPDVLVENNQSDFNRSYGFRIVFLQHEQRESNRSRPAAASLTW